MSSAVSKCKLNDENDKNTIANLYKRAFEENYIPHKKIGDKDLYRALYKKTNSRELFKELISIDDFKGLNKEQKIDVLAIFLRTFNAYNILKRQTFLEKEYIPSGNLLKKIVQDKNYNRTNYVKDNPSIYNKLDRLSTSPTNDRTTNLLKELNKRFSCDNYMEMLPFSNLALLRKIRLEINAQKRDIKNTVLANEHISNSKSINMLRNLKEATGLEKGM